MIDDRTAEKAPRGRPPFLEDPVRIHITVDRETHDRLRDAAYDRGLTISTLIRGIISRALSVLHRGGAMAEEPATIEDHHDVCLPVFPSDSQNQVSFCPAFRDTT